MMNTKLYIPYYEFFMKSGSQKVSSETEVVEEKAFYNQGIIERKSRF